VRLPRRAPRAATLHLASRSRGLGASSAHRAAERLRRTHSLRGAARPCGETRSGQRSCGDVA
jgi:hypothetical protein